MTHTFAICAYKKSEYLTECIESVISQGSKVIVCTSTPSEYIDNICEKYGLKLYVRDGKSNIADDWNFAISCADTDLVTLAHQDDVYDKDYVHEMLCKMNKCSSPIMFSSNYGELRGDKAVYSNKLLNIKKILRIPLKISGKSIFMRRMSLSFGNSICCPSVTYVKNIMKDHPFKKDFRASLDWQMWEELSHIKGEFAYSDKPLMLHRIHEGSETSNVIGDTGRSAEDYEMFKKFWPEFIAKMLIKKYKEAEKSNAVG